MTPEERRAYDREYWHKNKAKRNKQKRDNYRLQSSESYEKRLAYLRKYKKEIQYPKHKTKHMKKVRAWKQENENRVSEYQRKTNSRRKYDKTMYEYHRLIIEIETSARGSPSGKATDFDSVIRRFDPCPPNHRGN